MRHYLALVGVIALGKSRQPLTLIGLVRRAARRTRQACCSNLLQGGEFVERQHGVRREGLRVGNCARYRASADRKLRRSLSIESSIRRRRAAFDAIAPRSNSRTRQ
jgi:hypothetical protein